MSPVASPARRAAPHPPDHRHHGLDALRGSMMLLGIVLHAAMFYLAAPPIPLPADPSTHPVFDALVLLIHSFRMPLFFVLAGYFTALLAAKYGSRGALVNRARRVGLPLLLGLVTIVPVTGWLMVNAMVSAASGEWQVVLRLEQLDVLDLDALAEVGLRPAPSPAHLWFLYYLCWFYLLIPLCRAAGARLAGGPLDHAAGRLLGSAWLPLLLVPLTMTTLWWFRGGLVFEGITYFTPHLPSLAYYGTFFLFGWLAHHHQAVLAVWRRVAVPALFAAVVLFPSAALVGLRAFAAPSDSGLHVISVALNGACTWALVIAVTGLVLRHLDRPSPWALYLSQASYWVYLLHMPVVVLWAWLLLPLPLHAALKFTLVVALTTLICFPSYHWQVRRTRLGVLLHGKRFDLGWPWQPVTPARSAQDTP